jgi:hypothetical protein
MDERREHHGPSLTDHVRQFRRVARLAAADPLRLLPVDALARLASLGAPVAELIELAPFERLRDALTAPPAASRRETPRARVQPFAPVGGDVLKPTATPETLLPLRSAGRNDAAQGTRTLPSASASPLGAGELLRRNETPATALADRRAALRRTIGAESPAATATLVTQPAAVTDPQRTRANQAREVSLRRGRTVLSEESDAQPRRLTPVPASPITGESGSVTSAGQLAPAVPARPVQRASFADTVRTAPGSSDPSSASMPPVAVDVPTAHDMPPAALRSEPGDTGSSTLSRSRSSPAASHWPERGQTFHADACEARRRGWKPENDSDLAESLFEALYRDGVDLPWP